MNIPFARVVFVIAKYTQLHILHCKRRWVMGYTGIYEKRKSNSRWGDLFCCTVNVDCVTKKIDIIIIFNIFSFQLKTLLLYHERHTK